jgi:hypothetical protein
MRMLEVVDSGVMEFHRRIAEDSVEEVAGG